MKRVLIILFAILAGAFLGEWLGYKRFSAQIQPPKVITDTLVIHDTFVYRKPVYHTKRVIDTVLFAVTDTVQVRDSVFIPLPIEQRVYEDSTYRAVVSGWRPSLDTISVFRSTIVVDRVQEVKLRPRWSIGLQAGVGLTIDGRIRATPYFGAGIQYILIQFGYDNQ